LRLYTHTHTHTGDCLLENKKTNNKVELKNNNIKFNKGRTMLFFSSGIGLSLFAFFKKIKDKYVIIYKEVRAGP